MITLRYDKNHEKVENVGKLPFGPASIIITTEYRVASISWLSFPNTCASVRTHSYWFNNQLEWFVKIFSGGEALNLIPGEWSRHHTTAWWKQEKSGEKWKIAVLLTRISWPRSFDKQIIISKPLRIGTSVFLSVQWPVRMICESFQRRGEHASNPRGPWSCPSQQEVRESGKTENRSSSASRFKWEGRFPGASHIAG